MTLNQLIKAANKKKNDLRDKIDKNTDTSRFVDLLHFATVCEDVAKLRRIKIDIEFINRDYDPKLKKDEVA